MWLLSVAQCENCRVLKMIMRIPYWKSIAWCVIVEYEANNNKISVNFIYFIKKEPHYYIPGLCPLSSKGDRCPISPLVCFSGPYFALDGCYDQYAQVHIRTLSQARYFQISLKNDQSHMDMKYHRNTKK